MKKKISLDRIFSIIIMIHSIISLLFLAFLYVNNVESSLITIVIFYIIGVTVLGVILILLIRRMLVNFTEEINNKMDAIINEKENITFDIESETLLSKIQNKLEKLYDILNKKSNASKEEKIKLQALISDISHQVKTPIANLKIYNSTLIERKLSYEKTIEFLELMDNQLSKLDFLMQSLIKMSRLEIGMIVLNAEPIPIYDTIAIALGGIILQSEIKNISLHVNCDPGIIVKHDRKWTSEALFNILDNAVKYSRQDGKITITVTELELYTKVDITDIGIGINEQNLNKIFQRFYREEQVIGIDGIGIGLYLSREIIMRQNGYIKVVSKLGKGSTFSVYFLR